MCSAAVEASGLDFVPAVFRDKRWGRGGLEAGMNQGSWFWPDLSDIDGAKDACRLGMWCAIIVASMTALFAVLALLGTSLMGVQPLALIDAVLFGAIAFGIHRYSRFAAVAGFTLYLLEKVYAVIQQGPLASGVLGIIFLIGFLNAMRGAFAYHKFQSQRPVMPFS